MFENIGKKIKGFIAGIFWCEAIIAIGIGVLLAEETEGISILIAVGFILVAWISSWLIYGFGEIIDKLSEIEQNTRGMRTIPATQVQPQVYHERNIKPEKISKDERIKNLEHLRSKGLITEDGYQQALQEEQYRQS